MANKRIFGAQKQMNRKGRDFDSIVRLFETTQISILLIENFNISIFSFNGHSGIIINLLGELITKYNEADV